MILYTEAAFGDHIPSTISQLTHHHPTHHKGGTHWLGLIAISIICAMTASVYCYTSLHAQILQS